MDTQTKSTWMDAEVDSICDGLTSSSNSIGTFEEVTLDSGRGACEVVQHDFDGDAMAGPEDAGISIFSHRD